MTILWETLGFAARCGLVFVTFAACVLVVALAVRGRRPVREAGHLEVQRLNDRLEAAARTLRVASLDRRAAREERKTWAKAAKERAPRERRVYVLDFKGDVMA
ncbi:MAG: protease SohB, partial [Deltaproteobacteria bacterium]|nr:protease SohB [Deltaproteobacteria bacterium]